MSQQWIIRWELLFAYLIGLQNSWLILSLKREIQFWRILLKNWMVQNVWEVQNYIRHRYIFIHRSHLEKSSGGSQESLWPTVESQKGWGVAFPKLSLSPSDMPVPLWAPWCVSALWHLWVRTGWLHLSAFPKPRDPGRAPVKEDQNTVKWEVVCPFSQKDLELECREHHQGCHCRREWLHSTELLAGVTAQHSGRGIIFRKGSALSFEWECSMRWTVA